MVLATVTPSLVDVGKLPPFCAITTFRPLGPKVVTTAPANCSTPFNNLALENLDQVIQRFPNSKYAKDSYQKKILVKSNMAAKHMSIARYYQKERK